jgi:hypothetical protein
MVKRNEFFEIIYGTFALFMFVILGSIIIKTTSNNLLSILSTVLFLIGSVLISITLFLKLLKLFRNS